MSEVIFVQANVLAKILLKSYAGEGAISCDRKNVAIAVQEFRVRDNIKLPSDRKKVRVNRF
jgi:hypothetical protein